MSLSIDLVLIVVNLLALAYSYGRFSEKLGSLETKLKEISVTINLMNANFYSQKDGVKLEVSVSALWSKYDEMKERCTENHAVLK
jgi:hypothetical protein